MLGVDGMDPQFVQQHWSALPHLDRLRRQGSFKPLKTSTPPQSPVAWSTFITGMDPDGHGIYDFVHRDPKTYLPFSSMSKTEEPRHTLSLGPYLFPLSKGQVIALRRGKAFWQILAAHIQQRYGHRNIMVAAAPGHAAKAAFRVDSENAAVAACP